MSLPEVPNRRPSRRKQAPDRVGEWSKTLADMNPVALPDAVPDIEIPNLEITDAEIAARNERGPDDLEAFEPDLSIAQLGIAIEYKRDAITKLVDEHDRRRLEIKSMRRDLAAQFSALSRRVNAVLSRADGVK